MWKIVGALEASVFYIYRLLYYSAYYSLPNVP